MIGRPICSRGSKPKKLRKLSLQFLFVSFLWLYLMLQFFMCTENLRKNERPSSLGGFLLGTPPPTLPGTIQEAAMTSQLQVLQIRGNILIAVITSRKCFKQRIKAIARTWAAQDRGHKDGITTRYFVGDPPSEGGNTSSQSGSLADISALARDAGIVDLSSIVVMNGVVDDEYPPVRKNAAMIEALGRIVQENKDKGTIFDWIFKTDDDTYVNIDALRDFVDARNLTEFQVWGQRGYGRPEDKDGIAMAGLTKAYCMGGPGYIMSRPTLEETARGMEKCVKDADSSPQRESLWHSDVVIGVCIHRQTGAGCWDRDDHINSKKVFRHNYGKWENENFVPDTDISETIAMHPFKEEGMMLRQNQRYVKLRLGIGKQSTARSKDPSAPWTTLDNMSDGPSSPGLYVLEDVASLTHSYGVGMNPVQRRQEDTVRSKFIEALGRGSSAMKNDSQKDLELLKCVTCTVDEGMWYSAVSQAGAISGHVNETLGVKFAGQVGGFGYSRMDIAVPYFGDDDKLLLFASNLGAAVKEFRLGAYKEDLSFRLLVTRYPDDQLSSKAKSDAFRKALATEAALNNADSVQFVEVVPNNAGGGATVFNRAQACNALHRNACHKETCILAVMDVDTDIGPGFIRNALSYVHPQASAYFPILWSEFNPENVKLVEEWFNASGMPAVAKFSSHRGVWRDYGFGMYAVSGVDAARLALNEDFVGWGGEDKDFYGQVSQQLNIVRMHEHGLGHVWHPKNCQVGQFVERERYQACIGSLADYEGSSLGLYLRSKRKEQKLSLLGLVSTKAGPGSSTEMNATNSAHVAPAPFIPTNKQKCASVKSNILIAVITSRKYFKQRIKAIASTWAALNKCHKDGITIRYFVGDAPSDGGHTSSQSGSLADISALARDAGIVDLSSIVVMNGVVDDEYPPVRKNAAMIEALARIVQENKDKGTVIDWIYKADDDTYVNIDALSDFVEARNPNEFELWGQRGYGDPADREGIAKAGLTKAYCMGGPGYVMSRPTLEETARGIKECVKDADSSPQREFIWHSDVIIGLCIHGLTGAGCWDREDHDNSKKVFRHNYRTWENFVPDTDISKTIAMHPFKEEGMMLRQNQRYVKLRLGIGGKNTARSKDPIAPWTTLDDMSDGPSSLGLYVLEDVAALANSYGVGMNPIQRRQEDTVRSKFIKALGRGSSTRKNHGQKGLELLKCVTCTVDEGTWYSAVSQAGAMSGHVDENFEVKFAGQKGGFGYNRMDIAVPHFGDDDKLLLFASNLGAAVKEFRLGAYKEDLSFRLLVTRYPVDKFSSKAKSDAFRKALATEAALNNADSVQFVEVVPNNAEGGNARRGSTVFNRAQAYNALHRNACLKETCILAVMDVDTDIGPSFIRNALSYVYPQASAYFPIQWSEFNPKNVKLAVEWFRASGTPVVAEFSSHRGAWHQYNYGTYAIAGVDSAWLTFNERLLWGGEDKDFYERASQQLNIVRTHEHGLTNIWHPIDCQVHPFVDRESHHACISRLAFSEGSRLGLYMRSVRDYRGQNVTYERSNVVSS